MRSESADHPPATSGLGDAQSRRLLDVRLVPHRSLTTKNVRLVMILFSLVSVASSVPFIVMGAWPVAGFMGLDVILLHLAFRASFRSALGYEHVLVTPMELMLAKVTPRGLRSEYRFHPAWVRLDREEHEEFGIQRLSLHSRGRRVEVAAFLGPDAKATFASGLSKALSEARRGARFS